MKKIFSLFKIQKEERLLVLFFLVVLVALNGLVINLYSFCPILLAFVHQKLSCFGL